MVTNLGGNLSLELLVMFTIYKVGEGEDLADEIEHKHSNYFRNRL